MRLILRSPVTSCVSSSPLLTVALRGGKVGFGKIIKLIDELVVTLKKEQEADTEKKEWCEAEIDKIEVQIEEVVKQVIVLQHQEVV